MANEREFRAALMSFAASSDARGTLALMLDMALWMGLAAGAILADPWWLKVPLAFVAGCVISTLFVLGHDAAHFSLVKTHWLNAVLARLAFLPSLHNTTLWRIQHNRLHHQFPNVKGLNSWWPLSPEEFRALPSWRQRVERLYRCGLGTGPYYLVERWWKHKFFPPRGSREEKRLQAWADFALLLAWLALWIAAALAVGSLGGKTPLDALAFGVVIPYFVWNVIMGFTVLVQHTHPRTPWFASVEEAQALGQEHRTVHARVPRWLGLFTHEIMEHPAHHLNPMIPSYKLRRAQAWLGERPGSSSISDPLTLRLLVDVTRQCKLYDYERHQWLDFGGNVTSAVQPSASRDLGQVLR
jgi:omega-6 fatty acid desaturase (delta-12 desaturase)